MLLFIQNVVKTDLVQVDSGMLVTREGMAEQGMAEQ